MKAIYHRFGNIDYQEEDTFEECERLLNSGEDNGQISGLGIYDESTDTFFVSNKIDFILGKKPTDVTAEILDALFEIEIEPLHIKFLEK